MNFTKRESLYPMGMRIVIHRPGQKPKKGGFDISYSQSPLVRRKNDQVTKYYYQLSFSYKCAEYENGDKVYFSYSYPYTFSTLQNFIKELALS